MTDRRSLHFGAVLLGGGAPAPARADDDASADLSTLVGRARELETSGFAALIVEERVDPFEPFTLLGALSTTTATIGLVAAVSAVIGQPFPLARRTATLDHLSHGRAGWQPVAGADEARTLEFVGVVRALWDSLADDAIVADKSTGLYLRGDRRHAISHRGEFFRVDGPLNLSRPPQGHPVVIVADVPAVSRSLAVRYADVITTSPSTLEQAITERRMLDAALTAEGRVPSDVRVWADVAPLLVSAGGAIAEAASADTSSAVDEGDDDDAIADRVELWADSGAVDGFVVDLPTLGERGRIVVERILPSLVARGRVVPPTGETLREHLALPRPGDGHGAAA